MPPSLLLDNTSDFNSTSDKSVSSPSRTLLLAPPSLAAHEETLRNVLLQHDRAATDLQMLDRLSTGSVKLPQMSYDLILILNDVNGTRSESAQYLGRNSFQQIFNALKAGGRIEAQDKTLGQDHSSADFREAILAGLVLDDGGMIKPKYSTSDTVPIKLLKGRSKNNTGPTTKDTVNSLNNSAITHSNNLESRTNETRNMNFSVKPSFNDENDDDDEELIDEDTLLTEEEINRPLSIPNECAPRAGKRRRACKDCTCGLAEKLAAEDAARRTDAEAQLRVLKLGQDELAEVDFTVQGKVGSCGNCSLGDAFRCASCPYIGMPAFKPGEEVRLLNNDDQF